MSDNDPEVIAASIMDFIMHLFPTADGALDRDTPLLDGASIDSLGVLELMMFLGKRFEFEISDEDFVADHFENVNRLAQFVIEKRATAQ